MVLLLGLLVFFIKIVLGRLLSRNGMLKKIAPRIIQAIATMIDITARLDFDLSIKIQSSDSCLDYIQVLDNAKQVETERYIFERFLNQCIGKIQSSPSNSFAAIS